MAPVPTPSAAIRTALSRRSLAAAGALWLAGRARPGTAGHRPGHPPRVRGGLLAPLGEPLGASARDGAETAAELINADRLPELEDVEVELVPADAGPVPPSALDAAKALLGRGPLDFLIVAHRSTVTAELARTFGTATPALLASLPQLAWPEDGYDGRSYAAGSTRAHLAASLTEGLTYLRERGTLPAERWLVVHPPGLEAVADAHVAALSRDAGWPAERGVLPGRPPEPAAGEAVLVVGTRPEEAAAALARSQALGGTVVVDATFAELGQLRAAARGTAAFAFVLYAADAAPSNDVHALFAGLYAERTGRPPDVAAALAFTTVQTVATAAQADASHDLAALARQVQETRLDGSRLVMPWPEVRFEAFVNVGARPVIVRLDGDDVSRVWPAPA